MKTLSAMTAHALCVPVRAWQLLISPVLPAHCRFAPSCSAYALDALRQHGPVQGAWLALRRIARCHPWGGQGFDPVPAPGAARRGEQAGR